MGDIGFINFAVDSFYLQILFVSLLFCRSFEKRRFFYVRLVLSSLACLAVFFFFPRIPVGEWFNLSFTLIFIANGVILKLCFRIDMRQIVLYNIAAASLQNLVAKFVTMFFIFGALAAYERSMLQLLVSSLVYIAACVAFGYFYVGRTGIGGKLAVSNRLFALLLTVSCAIVLLFSPLCDAFAANAQMRIISMCLLIIVDMMVLCAEFGVFERDKLEKEKETIDRLLYMQKGQRAMFEQNIEVINRKCHDMRHQIALLKTAGETEDRRKYITEMERSLSDYDLDVETENKALDIVLTEYCLVCRNNDIRFTYMADGEAIAFMDSADIYGFFGNAFENAVESLRGEDADKRTLDLRVERRSGCVIVNMSNYFGGELDVSGGLPKTTKADDGFHGFGLKSIRHITRKYDGELSVTVKKDSFILQAIFPL